MQPFVFTEASKRVPFVFTEASKRVHVVSAPMGGRKTTKVFEYIGSLPADKSVLVVTPRRTLTLSHCQKLNEQRFAHYWALDVSPMQPGKRDLLRRIVITPESLYKLECAVAPDDLFQRLEVRYNLVYLDELSLIAHGFASDATHDHKAHLMANLSALRAIVRRAERVISTCADLINSPINVALLRFLAPSADYELDVYTPDRDARGTHVQT